jgi:NhaP-type Na+/H+ or K+/H+ antiporter
MHRAAAVVFLFVAGTAQADPGHGSTSLWHLLTEPDHLAMILLPLAIVIGVVIGVRARFLRIEVRARNQEKRKIGL